LRKRGYTPVALEKDETYGTPPFYNGIPSKSNKQIGKTLLEAVNIINHSEFYIGLSSGMSWIAHALGKKVVMISNFTEDWNEFDLSLDDYIRITDKSVCHGCWNKINVDHTFDKHDWYWCPKHKGTERQFECHTSITPEMVLENIKHWL
jgi:autotransporter strand-loop-strand O-heptosyltransferase